MNKTVTVQTRYVVEIINPEPLPNGIYSDDEPMLRYSYRIHEHETVLGSPPIDAITISKVIGGHGGFLTEHDAEDHARAFIKEKHNVENE